MENEARYGDWIKTFSGREFWPLDPRLGEVAVLDIAHHLSNICRFGGACAPFYSVADHAVRVSRVAEKRTIELGGSLAKSLVMGWWGLHHDDSEAYLGDWVRPIKKDLEFAGLYAKYEEKLMRVIKQKFGMQGSQPEVVSQADVILLATEKRDLMCGMETRPWIDWHGGYEPEPLPEKIVPFSSVDAETLYLGRFWQLAEARGFPFGGQDSFY